MQDVRQRDNFKTSAIQSRTKVTQTSKNGFFLILLYVLGSFVIMFISEFTFLTVRILERSIFLNMLADGTQDGLEL